MKSVCMSIPKKTEYKKSIDINELRNLIFNTYFKFISEKPICI